VFTVAILVAAGRGERLGADRPKAFVVLAGRPMLEWSVAALSGQVDEIVVALPPGERAPAGTRGVPGGDTRSHSVANALAASAGDPVLVHDAARPLITPALVRRALDGLGDFDAAIAAAPVSDTIKEVRGDEVVRTLDRAALWAVQTPQVFRRAALAQALAGDLAGATDDAMLVERAGGRVRVIPFPRENLKVTTPVDREIAERLLC